MLKHTIFIILLIFHAGLCQENQVALSSFKGSQNVTVSRSSDLSYHNFKNKAVSVCVSGLALFYQDHDFEGKVEYVYGPKNVCTDLKLSSVSSVRHPGFQEDISKNSITLYQDRAFTGRDYLVHGDKFGHEKISGDFKKWTSLIVTGGSDWTVYDGHRLTGNSACLISPNSANKTPGFLVNAIEIPSFGNWVASVEIGCSANSYQNKFYLSSFSQQGPA